MVEILQATLAGFICGAIFTFIGLPIPAPPVLAGIMGIVGVFLGFLFINWLK